MIEDQTTSSPLLTPFTMDQSAWLQHQLTSVMMRMAGQEKRMEIGKRWLSITIGAIRANTFRPDPGGDLDPIKLQINDGLNAIMKTLDEMEADRDPAQYIGLMRHQVGEIKRIRCKTKTTKSEGE